MGLHAQVLTPSVLGIFWHFPNWQQFWDPSDAVLFLPNMILIKSKQILHSILHPHHVLEQLISSQFGSGLDILRYIFRLQFFWPEDWLIQKLLPRWVYPATIQQTFLIQKLEYIFGNVQKSWNFRDFYWFVIPIPKKQLNIWTIAYSS